MQAFGFSLIPFRNIALVDNPFKIVFFTDRHINSNRAATQGCLHVVNSLEVIRTLPIKFIDKGNAGDLKLFCPLPERLGLSFNAVNGRNQQHSSTKDTHAAARIMQEICITGSIYNMQFMAVPFAMMQLR